VVSGVEANLLSFILEIPRSACATFNSLLSRETGGKDSRSHVSALIIKGSMSPSSSSMRDHIMEVLELVLRVTSRSITNWVAETMTCWAWRKTVHAWEVLVS
jgi:hypothetical protein